MNELTDVRYEVERGLAWITIDRPERMNAFRARTVDELIHCLKRAWASTDVGVVCLTGSGDRAFCTGGDQKQRAETGEEFWDRVLAINFKGCLHTTRALLPGMLERGYGRVVNIASDAGRVGSSMESVYSGAKGGVIAFTKTIAREAARSGVTANVVCPGPTRTPMLEQMTAEGGERLVDSLVRAVPMRRLGEPDDVAAAVSFFASDRAGFITGQTLSVSGGLTMA